MIHLTTWPRRVSDNEVNPEGPAQRQTSELYLRSLVR